MMQQTHIPPAIARPVRHFSPRHATRGAVRLTILFAAALSAMAIGTANAEPIPLPTKAPSPNSASAKTPKAPPPDVWSASEIEDALRVCNDTLKSVHAVFDPLPPIKAGRCGAPAPIRLISIGKDRPVRFVPAPTINCDMIAPLKKWLDRSLQPLAERHLDSRIATVNVMSSYSCRTRYGRAGARMSEHAYANALDIAGFSFIDKRTVSVLKHWGPTRRDIDKLVADVKNKAPPLPSPSSTAAAAAARATAKLPLKRWNRGQQNAQVLPRLPQKFNRKTARLPDARAPQLIPLPTANVPVTPKIATRSRLGPGKGNPRSTVQSSTSVRAAATRPVGNRPPRPPAQQIMVPPLGSPIPVSGAATGRTIVITTAPPATEPRREPPAVALSPPLPLPKLTRPTPAMTTPTPEPRAAPAAEPDQTAGAVLLPPLPVRRPLRRAIKRRVSSNATRSQRSSIPLPLSEPAQKAGPVGTVPVIQIVPRPSPTGGNATSGSTAKFKPPYRLGGPKRNTADSGYAAFLRGAHRSACRIFGTTLGPEANEAHRNHFHIDMFPRRRSNFCE